MKGRYNIGEISEIFQIPKPTLRYWESENLIQLNRNEENDYREYTLKQMMEIGDISLYRQLNVPVAKLKNMHQLGIHDLDSTLDATLTEVDNRISQLSDIKERLLSRKEKIQQLSQLQEQLFTKCEPDVEKIVFYEMDDKNMLHIYLQEPYSYAIVIPFGMNENNFNPLNGLAVPATNEANPVIWEKDNENKTYIKCLLKISRDDPRQNNFQEIMEKLAEQGYKTGTAIARYLVTAKETLSYDFYKAWIEIL
jgi:DNA-binding transcriptional MerR regulator